MKCGNQIFVNKTGNMGTPSHHKMGWGKGNIKKFNNGSLACDD